MNEREALMRAICESPADDTPRLVFADWLEERGTEADSGLARLIWAQIELNQLRRLPAPRSRDLVRAEHLKKRQRQLLRHADGTALPDGMEVSLATFTDPEHTFGLNGAAVVRRGFVCELHLTGMAFTGVLDTVFRCQPVTDVNLFDLSAVDGVAWYRAGVTMRPRSGPHQRRRLTGQERERNGLPRVLFDCLPGVGAKQNWIEYETTDRAYEALSVACVTLGRKRAGLAPLESLVHR